MKDLKAKIEDWLIIHHDNNVRIENRHIEIIAKNTRNNDSDIEYVSIEHGCPCCEGTTYTYFTFDEIDFDDCVLSFEDPSGNTIYVLSEGKTTDTFKERLSEEEIVKFFNKDWYTLGTWREGEGRGQTNYEILKAGWTTIISLEDYGFDDFHQPIYFYINKG